MLPGMGYTMLLKMEENFIKEDGLRYVQVKYVKAPAPPHLFVGYMAQPHTCNLLRVLT
jgi:hypothetical protein